MKNKRSLWIVAALSTAVLVPLYGDPRRAPVTHSEWARMMMRSLGFEDALQNVENADTLFRGLAWKDERYFVASKYKRGTGVIRRGVFVDSGAESGESAYDLPVVRSGDYNVRLRLQGAPDRPFKVEIRKDGGLDSVETYHPTGSGSEYTSVDLGWVRLEPGNHTLSVILPPGTSLESIQISPPCLRPIEPENGWRAAALATSEDLARTMLQALDLENELPPADDPIELRAEAFDRLAPESVLAKGGDGTEGYELRASAQGLHAIVYADIETAGLYAVSVWTVEGGGQSWLADSCRRSDICPSGDVAPRWRTILTSDFNVGRHSFSVLMADGAKVGRIRLQRLKASPEDYVAALKRVGFDSGPKGQVTRARAREAMEWLQGRWKQWLAASRSCNIQPPLGRLTVAGQLAGGGLTTLTTPPGGSPPGPSGPPGGGPPGPPTLSALPPPVPPIPQPPATPVLPVR